MSPRTAGKEPTAPPRRPPAAAPASEPKPHPGRSWLSPTPRERPGRVAIESVQPSVDGGRFAAKRVVGDRVVVSADVFAEGHDRLIARIRYRTSGSAGWHEAPMEPVGNDRWQGEIIVSERGRYELTVTAWVDEFVTWRIGLEKKVAVGVDVKSELAEGAELVAAASARAENGEQAWLAGRARALRGNTPLEERVTQALDPELQTRMTAVPDRTNATTYPTLLPLEVDRPVAAVGAWYEMFPRSAAPEPGRHGTLADAIERLPYVAAMGFDVLYLPPIHPIGRSYRKGRNNTPAADPSDVGSPWAIGGPEGGHDAIHPDLGTLDDFDRLVRAAADQGLELALDIAFQCSPDHPWVREHPEWFRHRPDGSIQYAENPPKKYQDIYPLDFESPAWRELWAELERVFRFWIDRGIRIFRVDNPHTKPFAFWEWVIHAIRSDHPDVVFLSEAFTRPRVMEYLAKAGFSQSYTYFTWRNTKGELERYLTGLTSGPAREYVRPNLFANTPDILHEYLQAGGRSGHQIRLVLAATLAGSYGIYGPLSSSPRLRRCRAPRNTWTRRSTRSVTGGSGDPTRWRPSSPGSTRSAGRIRRSAIRSGFGS